MDPRKSAVALAAVAVLLAQGRPADAGCLGATAFWDFAGSDEFRDRPFSTIASRSDIPEACRREVMTSVAHHVASMYSNGLCPRGRCGGLVQAARAAGELGIDTDEPLCQPIDDPTRSRGCVLQPRIAASLAVADARVAEVAERGIDAVVGKLGAGRVPYCLVSDACLGDDPGRCRVYLRWLWWTSASAEMPRGRELWLQSGGFPHLLLGDAFTCSVNLQRGGTCAIYSAAALISHYCATPARNPEVRNSCVEPEGATCVPAETFLERAYELGCWTAQTCSAPGQCRPAVDDVSQAERSQMKEKLQALGCLGTAALPPACRAIFDRLNQAPAGAQLPCLAERVYPAYGFGARTFPGTDAGWNAVRRSVNDGHPVQVHISPSLWAQYFGTGPRGPGLDLEHAVVLEAFWTDYRGQERVLVRDSNNAMIVALPSPTVRSSYIGRPGGVSICLPGDARCPPMSGAP